jgi:hypothetical protein
MKVIVSSNQSAATANKFDITKMSGIIESVLNAGYEVSMQGNQLKAFKGKNIDKKFHRIVLNIWSSADQGFIEIKVTKAVPKGSNENKNVIDIKLESRLDKIEKGISQFFTDELLDVDGFVGFIESKKPETTVNDQKKGQNAKAAVTAK